MLEDLVELEHANEVVTTIRRLTDQQVQIDEREDNIANVGGRTNPPMIENVSSEQPVPLECKIPAGGGELTPPNVATFSKARLAELQGGEHEQVRELVKAPLS